MAELPGPDLESERGACEAGVEAKGLIGGLAGAEGGPRRERREVRSDGSGRGSEAVGEGGTHGNAAATIIDSSASVGTSTASMPPMSQRVMVMDCA